MKVLFLTQTTGRGASARYRVYQYLDYLQANHIQTEVKPALSDRQYDEYHGNVPRANSQKFFFYSGQCLRRLRDILEVRKYDIVFLQRDLIIHIYPFLEKIVRGLNPRLIFDFDDAVYLVPPGVTPSPWRNWFYDREKIGRIIRWSAYTICGNNFLKRYASKYSHNVTVIPTSLNPAEYALKDDYAVSGRVIIGWIGSPFTTYYLKTVSGPLRRLSQKHDIIFRIVGGEGITIPGVRVQEIPWREGEEVKEIRKFDIGIMPLTDEEWSWGKCGFKLLQYMACGIPAVASPIGVNQEIIRSGENGFWALREEEWVGRLSQLIADKTLREKLGRAGRQTVETEYSIQCTAPRLQEILIRVYNSR